MFKELDANSGCLLKGRVSLNYRFHKANANIEAKQGSSCYIGILSNAKAHGEHLSTKRAKPVFRQPSLPNQ